jgi:YVTN family beta-propeller protein
VRDVHRVPVSGHMAIVPTVVAAHTPSMVRRGGTTQRLLTTVLFTDIVGSTERAARLGDRSWKDLIARHHAIVRRELRRFHGRENDTAGDGFFATFEQPVEAIECATAIIDGLRAIDLQIRAGIHTGEAEVMGHKVGGITVHVASRALHEAAPGEILVTNTVREVTAGADVTFSDRGVHEFKGVPGDWHVYAVEWHPREPSSRVPGAAELDPGAASRRRVRWGVAIGGALLVTAVAVMATYTLLGRSKDTPPVVPLPNSAVQVDQANEHVVSAVPITSPTGIAADGDTVWVLSREGLVNAIPAAGGPATPIRLPGSPTGIAAADGAAWITFGHGIPGEREGIVVRVDAGSHRQQTTSLGPGSGATGIAVGEGGVWVVNEISNTLTRIDPVTRAVSKTVPVGEQPVVVATGAGSVWVAHAVGRSVWRLDPQTMQRTAGISLRDAPTAIIVAFGRVWVTSSTGNSVAVIDAATNRPVTTIEVDQGPRGIAAGARDVWVAGARGSIMCIDAASAQLAARVCVSLPGPAEDVAVSGDTVWGTVQE